MALRDLKARFVVEAREAIGTLEQLGGQLEEQVR